MPIIMPIVCTDRTKRAYSCHILYIVLTSAIVFFSLCENNCPFFGIAKDLDLIFKSLTVHSCSILNGASTGVFFVFVHGTVAWLLSIKVTAFCNKKHF